MREPTISRNRASATGAAATLALLGVIPACVRGAAYQDELEAVARGAALRRARSFIAVVRSADPASINEYLADGLEFKRRPEMAGEWYSFYWKGRNVIGPFPLERYKDPKRFNLMIEEDGTRVRVFGTHDYKRFLVTGPEIGYRNGEVTVTGSKIAYSDGELAEVLADLEQGGAGRRAAVAVRWLANHAEPNAVPALIRALDKRYDALDALWRTTFQTLEHRADWERWYEANGSKSREQWRADAREKCLALLKSDDLAARIEGVKHARLVGGMEEDVRKALTFPDEAYVTSIAKDESGYALVITNRSPSPALIALTRDRCGVRFSMTPAKPDGPRIGGGRSRASLPVQYDLRILKPGKSLVKRFELPEGLVPGDYLFTVSRRDAMNGRTYETSFILIIP